MSGSVVSCLECDSMEKRNNLENSGMDNNPENGGADGHSGREPGNGSSGVTGNPKIRLSVVFGGQSSEHEISCISAASVLQNIDREKYEVRMMGITRQGEWLPYQGAVSRIANGEWEAEAREARRRIQSARNTAMLPAEGTSSCLQLLTRNVDGADTDAVDVVFPVLHGPNGEDGTIQGLFQLAGVPFVGCGLLASAAGMDKAFSKIVFASAGIPQARFLTVRRSEIRGSLPVLQARVGDALGYPCFVKPANAGSSGGISKVKPPEALGAALEKAAGYDSKILVEEFIDGREVECAILGNEEPEASVVGEILPCNEFYDYEAKYLDDRSQTIIPADLPEDVTETVRRLAVRAFQALGASGLSRVDFFVERGTDRVVLNEINTIPGFTSISMYAKLWAASGVPYPELVDRLIMLALRRHEETAISFDRDGGRETTCSQT